MLKVKPIPSRRESLDQLVRSNPLAPSQPSDMWDFEAKNAEFQKDLLVDDDDKDSQDDDSFDRGRPDNGSVDLEEEAGVIVTDYKRGKRLKKLLALLRGPLVVSSMRQFMFKMYICLFALFVTHIITFTIMTVLLIEIQDSITDLEQSGFASRKIFEIAIDVLAMNSLARGAGTPQQDGAYGGIQDFDQYYTDLDYVSGLCKTLHSGVYLGFNGYKQLPLAYGIRDIWVRPVSDLEIEDASMRLLTFLFISPDDQSDNLLRHKACPHAQLQPLWPMGCGKHLLRESRFALFVHWHFQLEQLHQRHSSPQ